MTTQQIDARIAQARDILDQLEFDGERKNERSALVLLALLGMTPATPWGEASNPMLRTLEIMAWIREHYQKPYAPNSRETIRRFTLHQFSNAQLITQNPDQPDRPINSPKWCYQLTSEALHLIQSYEQSGFADRVREYLDRVPSLQEQSRQAREMNRIPATLPDGSAVTLSPGGQNVLIKQMVEVFAPLFTPRGQVLFVGDTDHKDPIYETETLARLGVVIPDRGKIPDLIVYMPDRNWLVLMEAASSHGPVDATRHTELSILFKDSTAGLVYVSCFPSRQVMRQYLHQIAWETEVWCAEDPTHLIHFNGERFLGPY